MPTTITSAGITFNDATSLTSAVIPANAVGATQIANGSVTAAKLGTTEQKQIAKAWVNFNGTVSADVSGTYSAASGGLVTVTIPSGHGMTYGQSFYADFTSGTGAADGVYQVYGLLSATQFTYLGQSLIGGNVTLKRSAIISSYNVSSVAKNGTADYTVNFTNIIGNMPLDPATYSVAGMTTAGNTDGSRGVSIASGTGLSQQGNAPTLMTSNCIRINTPGSVDSQSVSLIVFGN